MPNWFQERAWAVAAFAVAFLAIGSVTASHFVVDGVMTLYLGRFVTEHGIPRVDHFTVAGDGRMWVDQQWLAQVISYETYRLAGYAGVVALATGWMAAGMYMLQRLAHRAGATNTLAFWWTTAAMVTLLLNTYVRAQSFAIPLFVALLALLMRDACDDEWRARTWLAILAILTVWANLHGSALVMAGFVAAVAITTAVRTHRSAAWYVGSALASCCTPLLTPYGFDVVTYYRDIFGNAAIAENISEWQVPQVVSLASTPFLILVVAVVALTARTWPIRSRRPPLVIIAAACAFGLLGCTAVRYHLWGSIALVPFAASLWPGGGLASNGRRIQVYAPALLILCGILASLLVFRSESDWFKGMPTHEVTIAARELERHPDRQIIADGPGAALLIWKHWDVARGRVGFDARLEQFRERDLKEYFDLQLASSPDWLDAADGYEYILISRRFRPDAASRIAREPGWTAISSSDDGILVSRR